jgi:uncharacterized protein (TIGR02646 family)
MVRTRTRGACPQSLQANRARWTRRWRRILEGRARGDWATPRAKQALKEAVTQLTHGKCVYCEGYLGAQSWTGVEHYRPKSNPDQAFEWTNLFPVCDICNGRKGSEDHRGVLLKPDDEDPERYFSVHPDTGSVDVALGLSAEESARAEATIRLCDLQRTELCDERARLFERLSDWILLVSRGPSDDLLQRGLRSYLDPRTAYKLVVRRVFESKGLAELAAEDRRRFQE